MQKEDFIKYLAQESNISIKDAAHSVNIVLEAIESALTKSKELSFIGFGKFNVKTISSKTGRNPKTGESLKIPAFNKVGFTPGVKLRAAANKHKQNHL